MTPSPHPAASSKGAKAALTPDRPADGSSTGSGTPRARSPPGSAPAGRPPSSGGADDHPQDGRAASRGGSRHPGQARLRIRDDGWCSQLHRHDRCYFSTPEGKAVALAATYGTRRRRPRVGVHLPLPREPGLPALPQPRRPYERQVAANIDRQVQLNLF